VGYMKLNNRGLEIIKKYEPEAKIKVGHDELWIGEYNPDAMTQEERDWMEEDGWMEDEGGWKHFV